MAHVLIACEESQRVCIEFRKMGHCAYSCGIQECSGGHPEWHIKGDVLPLLNGWCKFLTCDGTEHFLAGHWDLIIAHPPCTDLAVSGARYFAKKQADGRQQKSIDFFMKFTNVSCDKIAIENPVSIMSTIYQKPTQIIQPWQFGHPVSKKTCLWLRGLPKLEPTHIVNPEWKTDKNKGNAIAGAAWYVTDENGKILSWNDPRTAKERAKTYPGIAQAMAQQWGKLL